MFSSFHEYQCGGASSWKRWLTIQGMWSETCSFEDCDGKNKPATLGAHVYPADKNTALTANWYIVPACKDCNARDMVAEVEHPDRTHMQKLRAGVSLTAKNMVVKAGISHRVLFGHPVPERFKTLFQNTNSTGKKRLRAMVKWFDHLKSDTVVYDKQNNIKEWLKAQDA